VWICGDCHVGNLGPIGHREGSTVIELRDLDQTVVGNPAHDVIRLALSLAMSARSSDLPGVTTARITEDLVAGYEQSFVGDVSKDIDALPAPIRLVMKRAVKRTWRHVFKDLPRDDEIDATHELRLTRGHISNDRAVIGPGRRRHQLALRQVEADVRHTWRQIRSSDHRAPAAPDVEDDGSFQIQVPANLPIQIQALDADGIALRSSAWIWVKNKENRGCIGCHEDGERTPENVAAKALTHPPARLTLAPERRRTVDFRRDIMPVLAAKCANGACHAAGSALPWKSADAAYKRLLSASGRYVIPEKARTSPLVWRIHGRNTSRPWGRIAAASVSPMPPSGSKPLTADERRAVVEWIDLGAHWDALPASGPGGNP
jgi:hypothetical protein